MATEAVDIGANFSSYRGDAGAAGGNFGPITIDTRPLDHLAAYTFYYNKSVWEQQKRETDAKVAELADLSSIALNNLRDKDKEQATKEFADLQKYASEYARKTPKNAQERMQNELEWQTRYGAFKNNYNSGKQRAIAYETQLAAINNTVSDVRTKDEQIKQLNEAFSKTDIGTPISAVPNFQVKKFDTPNPTAQKFNSIVIGANENVAIDGSIYNPKLNAGVADATILDIKKSAPKKGTPEYLSLTETERNQADIQNTIEGTASGWVDAVTPLNEALKKYIDANGKFDATSFENDNASNTTLMNAYNALKNYDNYNRQRYEQAKTGMFTDKGLQIKLPDNVTPDDFKVGFVDFAKGVNPNQLVQSGMFAKWTGDTFTKKVTETDNAIQRANISQNYAQLNETIRHNKANEKLNSDEIKNNEAKWKASVTGSTTQVNGAIERAKRIYNDLLKLTNSQGIISPDKVRQLNVEQLKYLGIEAPQERDEQGTIISSGGFKPLDLTGESKYAIQLINGEVKVLRDAKPNDALKGSFVGQWDNTKSTNLFNIGTNILNEELKNAGTKELNSYMGIDVINGITTNTSGGSATVSGSTQTQSTTGGMTDAQYQEFLKKNGLK